MNTKGQLSDNLMWTVSFSILVILFFTGIYFFISNQRNNAAYWEDFYAKEVGFLINSGKSGDVIYLDVTKATTIANKHKISAYDIFTFDNVDNYVSVHLSEGSAARFYFFNDVDVIPGEPSILLISEDIDTNRLYFTLR